jgi:uncharacterized protein (DUF305 family)
MNITRRIFVRSLAGAGVISTIVAGMPALAQTPAAVGCTAEGTPQGMGGMGHEGHGEMSHGTPMAGMHDVEFDQMYIDMMLPHHASIIALAEVAQPVLKDRRLQEMAKDIITTQTDEQVLMQDLREEWYGSRDPEPLTPEMMNVTMGHSSCDSMDMDNMMNVMDAEWQVETFLAADDPDLAFIEQTLLHHQMAIDSSEIALKQAIHPELKEIAQDVIDAQQREIDTLEMIRSELTGEATPAS